MQRPLQDYSKAHEALPQGVWETLLSDLPECSKREDLFAYMWELGLRCPNCATMACLTALVFFKGGCRKTEMELYNDFRSMSVEYQKLRKRNEKRSGKDEDSYPLVLDVSMAENRVSCMYPLASFLFLQAKIPTRNTRQSVQQSRESMRCVELFSKLCELQKTEPVITFLGQGEGRKDRKASQTSDLSLLSLIGKQQQCDAGQLTSPAMATTVTPVITGQLALPAFPNTVKPEIAGQLALPPLPSTVKPEIAGQLAAPALPSTEKPEIALHPATTQGHLPLSLAKPLQHSDGVDVQMEIGNQSSKECLPHLSMLEAAERFKNLTKGKCEKELDDETRKVGTLEETQGQSKKTQAAEPKNKTSSECKRVQKRPLESKNMSETGTKKKDQKNPVKKKGSASHKKPETQQKGGKRGKKQYDPWKGIPKQLLKKYANGCARCRHRMWCTQSCWSLRGYRVA